MFLKEKRDKRLGWEEIVGEAETGRRGLLFWNQIREFFIM
jgi:hypothetical protein